MTEIEKLTKDLTDKGQLIEAGFVALRHMAIAKDATDEQVDEMRSAFFAGAQHLFTRRALEHRALHRARDAVVAARAGG